MYMPGGRMVYVSKCPPKIVVLRLLVIAFMRIRNILIFSLFFLSHRFAVAQKKLEENFSILYEKVDKDNPISVQELGLTNTFTTGTDAIVYLAKISSNLAVKGFPTASVDSIEQTDSTIIAQIFIGKKYSRFLLNTKAIERPALEASGFLLTDITNKPVNIPRLQLMNEKLLSYYETKGYPFANVFLDSVLVADDTIHATLTVNKGVEYHIDSMRVYGKARINNKFLQQHLSIPNGSLYNKNKLAAVDARLAQLPYLTVVQPSDITMLGSGSVLNLYLNEKKSSQINFIVGFLPASTPDGKNQVTGDVNLDLKNLLGSGENFLLRWQALQPKSPRLNIGYDQPYIFHSPFGLNFLFDLFKKDSNFVQVNAQAGIQFTFNNTQTGKLFLQLQNNSLLQGAIDTNNIKLTKTLPINSDVTSINTGIVYDIQTTDYRFNPRRGNEFNFTGAVGTKKIKVNNQVSQIKDPNFDYITLYDSVKQNSYQLRLKFSGAHFFPVGKRSTFKTAFNIGLYNSPSVFRNELFQIGGYKLLRGFNEESIYAKNYAVGTLEYRLLIGLNSYLFTFADVGYAKNKYQDINVSNNFTGAGLGIVNETKIGLLNLSLAVGKRNDVPFNLRESAKIHFGYVNYF